MDELIKLYDCFYHITLYENLESIKRDGLVPKLNDQYKGIIEKPFICLFPPQYLIQSMEMFTNMSDAEYIIFKINSSDLIGKEFDSDKTHGFYKLVPKWNELSKIDQMKCSIEKGCTIICYENIPWDELHFLGIKFSKANLRQI